MGWAGAALAAMAALVGAAPSTPTGAWLDRPLTGWNRAGAAVPNAPAPDADGDDRQRCASVIRSPSSPSDRALVAAGWSLAGPAHARGDLVVLMGNAAWDGMCRPWAFQVFVFAGGRFAGTLAPAVMNARTDGAWQAVHFEPADHLSADFLRYTDADPLCCPSRLSTVRFRIAETHEGRVVLPLAVSTRTLPRQ